MKLNLGSGNDYREGWINLDNDNYIKKDMNFDISKIYQGTKLPFEDNYFETIILYDVLEHLPEPLPILREVYRICKVGGIIEIKCPLGKWTWDNLDHKREFGYNSFDLANFDYQYDNTKKVKTIKKETYSLPSSNILKRIYKHFFKRNIYIIYKKIR